MFFSTRISLLINIEVSEGKFMIHFRILFVCFILINVAFVGCTSTRWTVPSKNLEDFSKIGFEYTRLKGLKLSVDIIDHSGNPISSDELRNRIRDDILGPLTTSGVDVVPSSENKLVIRILFYRSYFANEIAKWKGCLKVSSSIDLVKQKNGSSGFTVEKCGERVNWKFSTSADEALHEGYTLAMRELIRSSLDSMNSMDPEKPTLKDQIGEQIKKTEPTSIVAVFNVYDASGRFEKDILDQLTNYLGTALTTSGKFRIIPHDQLRARIAEEKKESYKECVEESCQIELGKVLAAQKSLATQLLKVGNKCALTANLFDLKTETTEKGAMVNTGCSPDELLGAMQQIAEQLSK
jgi:hypothetical protein